jgi:hypothetical protein
MASHPPCSTCPVLRRELNETRTLVHHLNKQIRFLRHWLAWVLAGVRAVIHFIDREQEHPSIPRRDILPSVVHRLAYVADTAERKN